MSSGTFSRFTVNYNKQALEAVKKDIETNLKHLERIINAGNGNEDLPVAFASNTLYTLERNNLGNHEYYDSVLIPLLKRKVHNLHAEGIAHTVWALSNAGIWD